jgi:hypothetical protein
MGDVAKVVECFLSMCKGLGSILSITKKRKFTQEKHKHTEDWLLTVHNSIIYSRQHPKWTQSKYLPSRELIALSSISVQENIIHKGKRKKTLPMQQHG